MAVNVTEKDKTLNEIIDWCADLANELRDAPPADAEIEAVAKKLMWWDMALAWEDVIPSEDYLWTLAEPEMRDIYLMRALITLETARKEVSE